MSFCFINSGRCLAIARVNLRCGTMSPFGTAVGVGGGFSEMRLVSLIVLIYLCKSLCSARRGERSVQHWGALKTFPLLHIYAASGLSSHWKEVRGTSRSTAPCRQHLYRCIGAARNQSGVPGDPPATKPALRGSILSLED